MALRPPVVFISGQMQNLPASDTLNAPQTGGDVISQTNDEAGAIVIGTPVYNDAADGVKKAKADAAGTKSVVGLVAVTSITNATAGNIQTNGILSATTGQWDAVAGTTGGLAFGTRYYLSAVTAGLLTSVSPSTSGQYSVEVGIAISTTEMKIDIKPPFLI